MRYFGVIGNRDYIKIQGEKRPFWEFLDEQPYGYLTSLVYMRKDLPDMPMVFDCGAWSYRTEDVPKITPESAHDAYAKLAKLTDIVIAPDHMLIPGVDLDARRALNKKWAQEFIKICSPAFTPMATIHGMDLDERIKHGKELLDMGYKYLAIGGVAARASQKTHIIEMVKQLRNELPIEKCRLHVLGLSSPDYFKAFSDIRIDSVDGSSHFKQAFTAGAFYTIVDGRLKKWQAARPGEGITAPECFCSACSALRNDGVDTRTYGSNEHNMGRAAHNMNMLMKAQKIALHGTTVLVSCVGKKAPGSCRAKDLYQSEWFRKARRWAEQNGSRWYILSALHGLLYPENSIPPYEKTLNEMPVEERKQWGKLVSNQLRNIPPGRIVILAGEKYREYLKTDRHIVDVPLKGLGIGQQLAWFNARSNTKQMEMFT
jgi:hypothetical protein